MWLKDNMGGSNLHTVTALCEREMYGKYVPGAQTSLHRWLHEDQRHSTGVDWTAKKCLLSTDGNLVCHVYTGKRKGRCNDDDIEEFLAQLGPACKHRLENLAVTCPVSAKLRQW